MEAGLSSTGGACIRGWPLRTESRVAWKAPSGISRATLRRVRGPKVVACLVRSLILMWSIDLEPGSVRGESQKCKQDDAAGSADAAADAAGSGGARERDSYRERRRWGCEGDDDRQHGARLHRDRP